MFRDFGVMWVLSMLAYVVILLLAFSVTLMVTSTLVFVTQQNLIQCSTEQHIGWFDYGDTQQRMTAVEYQEYCDAE
jgi:hypothetical protein